MDNPSSIIALLDGLGGMEMLVIFVLSLMLFGGKRLPEVAKGLGKSVREFRRAASGVEDEIRKAMDLDDRPTHRRPARRPRPRSKALENPGETPMPEPRQASSASSAAAGAAGVAGATSAASAAEHSETEHSETEHSETEGSGPAPDTPPAEPERKPPTDQA